MHRVDDASTTVRRRHDRARRRDRRRSHRASSRDAWFRRGVDASSSRRALERSDAIARDFEHTKTYS